MAILLDYDFSVGGDQDPVSTPLGTPGSVGSFRRIGGAGAVSVASTFSVFYDAAHTYPQDQKSTIYFGTLGGRDCGPACRINTTNGACYFAQNADATNIQVYKYNGVGGYSNLGTVAGVAYNAAKRYSMQATGSTPTTLQMYEDDVAVGSPIVDDGTTNGACFTSGPVGGTGFDATFRFARFVGADLTAGGPTPVIVSVSDSTPQAGDSVTLTVTDGGATQGTGSVTLGGVSQTVTSWSDTSIVITVARGGLKFGTQALILTADGGAASASFNVTFTPATGWAYVDLGTPNPLRELRLSATPDLVSGDQVSWDTHSGLVTVASDGTYSFDPSVFSFVFEVWNSGNGWGLQGLQQLYEPKILSGRTTAILRRARKAARKSALHLLKPAEWGGLPITTSKWFAPEFEAGTSTTATISGAGGIASGEAFGSPTLTRGSLVSVTGAGGIASGEAFGSPTVARLTLASVTGAGGIASGEAFGSPTLTRASVATVTGAGGIASSEAFGVPTVTRSSLAAVTGAGGVASSEAFGVPTVTRSSVSNVSGAGDIASGEAFGVPTLTRGSLASVTGAGDIASGEAFGVPALSSNGLYQVSDAGGIASGEAFGSPTVTRVAVAAVSGAGGIASGEAFGTPTVTRSVLAAVTGAGGIASGEAFGSPTVTRSTVAAVTGAGGIASGEAFGSPAFTRFMLALVSGAGDIASGEAFGVPAVSANGAATVTDAGGIVSGEAFGTPTLARQAAVNVLGAGGIVSGEAFGLPLVDSGTEENPSAAAIAAAVWQRVIENGRTAEEILRILKAPLVGTASGIGTSTETYYAEDGITPRVIVSFDAQGNRTAVVLDGA